MVAPCILIYSKKYAKRMIKNYPANNFQYYFHKQFRFLWQPFGILYNEMKQKRHDDKAKRIEKEEFISVRSDNTKKSHTIFDYFFFSSSGKCYAYKLCTRSNRKLFRNHSSVWDACMGFCASVCESVYIK